MLYREGSRCRIAMTKQEIAVLKAINYEGVENINWTVVDGCCHTAYDYTLSPSDTGVELPPHIAVWYRIGMYSENTEGLLKTADITLRADGEWFIAIFPIKIEE